MLASIFSIQGPILLPWAHMGFRLQTTAFLFSTIHLVPILSPPQSLMSFAPQQ